MVCYRVTCRSILNILSSIDTKVGTAITDINPRGAHGPWSFVAEART